MKCSISPLGFVGWVKSFKLVYLVMYFSVSKNLQKTTQLLLCW